jgi:hypothetical protein
MLYNKDKKVKRSYAFLLEPKSNEHLKKNQKKGQHIITKLQKKQK